MNDLSETAQQAIDAAVDDLLQDGVAAVSSDRLRAVLRRVALDVQADATARALLSLRGTADLAAQWGVERRRAQAHIRRLHERYGVGARVGDVWVMTADEAERYAPGSPGRNSLARRFDE